MLSLEQVDELTAGESSYIAANVSDYEVDNLILIHRDLNVEDGSLFDEDESLNAELVIRWDIDTEKDTNKNGILDDDYILPNR